jgi:RHS repeat-associated protein
MQDEHGTTAYAYDALHRLVAADPPNAPDDTDAIHYAYDRAGSRSHSGSQSAGQWAPPYQTYTYAPPTAQGFTQRLVEVRSETNLLLEGFSYDANGNATSWTHAGVPRTLAWDTLGRLVSITGGFSASYRYDPLGRRIEKTEAGETLRYQSDGLDVVAEYSVGAGGASALAATYVFGPGIDEPLKIKRGATLAAYHSDGLGSILAVSQVSTSGSPDLLTYRYDAFGAIVATSGSLDSVYTFTGRERDLSGLYYYRARYYLAEVGRFLSPDPIGLLGGTHAYAYVGSNPVNFTDPFGLAPRAGPSPPPAFQSGEGSGGLLAAATAIAVAEPTPVGEAALLAAGATIAGVEAYRQATERTFVTYTLKNPEGQTYVGRASGFGTPHQVMMQRYYGHEMRALGFGNPTLDRSAQGIFNRPAIRGREQQLIDFYGGVGSPGVANAIRAVSPYNPFGRAYHAASDAMFGPLAPYTGY